MVCFLYHHNYEAERIHITVESASEGSKKSINPSGDCNTLMHAKLYALGDKYGIDSLKIVASSKFAEAVTYAWNHPDFATTIKFVFSSTPEQDRGLRYLVVRAILEHQDVLSKKVEVEAVIKSIESLAYDLWKEAAKTLVNGVKEGPTCNACGDVYVGFCVYCGSGYVTCNCKSRPCPHCNC